MKIGIDCRTILDPGSGESAGVGHYTDALVRHLIAAGKNGRFVLFFDKHSSPALRHELGAYPHVDVRIFPFHVFARRIPLVESHVVLSALFRRERLDVLHGPANVTPLFYRGRTVVTVHDLAIYGHPEWFPSSFPGGQTFSKRIVVPATLARAARVISVSSFTAREAVRLFGLDEGKIDVIHEGVAPPPIPPKGWDFPGHDGVLSRYGLEKGRYFLFLGTIEPRKNIPRIAKAFVAFVRSAGAKASGFSLVIAGREGWKSKTSADALHQAAASLRGTGASVIRTGYVSPDDKWTLIAHASAMAFPTLYEGFGLPVLEAMSVGTPVITSDRTAMPEVAGDAALLVDPEDMASVAEAMRRVAYDDGVAETLAEKGRQRARGFSWERTAADTLAVYRRACGPGTR